MSIDFETMQRELSETRQMVSAILRKLETSKTKPATYTRADAAREIGVSKATITKMINEGRLHTTADGRYITREEIQRYLNI